VLPATGRSGPGGTSTARPGCRIALSSARARGRLVAGVLAADGRRCTVTASVWSLTSRRRLTAIRRLHAPPAGQTIAFTLRASRRLPTTVVLRLAARAADGRIGDVRRVVLHVRRAAAVRFSRR
jgi:hypothetical protein